MRSAPLFCEDAAGFMGGLWRINSVTTSVLITNTIVGILTMTLVIGIIVTSIVTRARALVAKAVVSGTCTLAHSTQLL